MSEIDGGIYLHASPYYNVIIRGRRKYMLRLMRISNAYEKRESDEDFDHDNDDFEHNFNEKGVSFP